MVERVRCAVVMDSIARIQPAKDSTLAMLRAAQERGWQLLYLEQGDLSLQDGKAFGRARPLTVRMNPVDWFTLGEPEFAVEPLDAGSLSHPWRHPDPRMDRLQALVARAVEEDVAAGRPTGETIDRITQLALAAAGKAHRHLPALRPPGPTGPRLTESWFC